MRTKMVRVAGAAIAAVWLALSGMVSAQSGDLIFQVGPANITFATSAGVEIYSGQGAPVTNAVGTIVGTANFIHLEKDPSRPYLPTVFEVSALGASYVVTEIRSPYDTLRRAFGFKLGPSGPTDFFDAAVLGVRESDGTLTSFFIKALPLSLAPTNASIDHAFFHTQATSQTTVGGTLVSSRSNSPWHEVVGPSQSVPVGENFNISAANSTQAYVMNFLRFTTFRESGAVVICTAPNVCGFAGIGLFQGFFGSAEPLSPAIFAIPANAFSRTKVTSEATGILAQAFGCRPGGPPPPRGLFAIDWSGTLHVRFESVACAQGYEIRGRFSDGRILDIRVDGTRFETGIDEGLKDIAVRSVGEEGVTGPFSPFQRVASIR